MSKASFELFRGQLMALKKPMALKALSIAEVAHEGVFRKDGETPYIEHPIKVASMLYDLGIQDDVVLAAAILHDVVEDTEITAYDLSKTFPIEVVDIVVALTKPISSDKSNSAKQRDYYAGIKANPKALLIKIADRVHNCSTLVSFTPEKRKNYYKNTMEHFPDLIKYAQHTYYEYASQFRILDLWLESILKTLPLE